MHLIVWLLNSIFVHYELESEVGTISYSTCFSTQDSRGPETSFVE